MAGVRVTSGPIGSVLTQRKLSVCPTVSGFAIFFLLILGLISLRIKLRT